MLDRLYRVTATRLNLRPNPVVQSGSELTRLNKGQTVVRLDDQINSEWWFVFADVAGDGIYVGYVSSRYLAPLDIDIEVPEPMELDDVEDSPSRDINGGEAEAHEAIHDIPDFPQTVWTDGWNPNIPAENRFDSPNTSPRRGNPIRRVVIHVTGTTDLNVVKNRFTSSSGYASAHYLVLQDGTQFQFVSEEDQAWHSGIQRYIRQIYARNDGSWRRYKRYFSWHSGYPHDAVYLDSNYQRTSKSSAALVQRANGAEWDDYRYFDERWGRQTMPVGYAETAGKANADSIGIEILSYGRSVPDQNVYSDAMYDSLASLVDDICRRHSLPKIRPHVVGHEDVNPVERWGWDPHQGFEWDRILDSTDIG